MVMPRLTKLVTFKRLKPDAAKDDAGQVDETLASNWAAIGKRRSEVEQLSSSESYTDDQVSTSSQWSCQCRGDDLTRSIVMTDKIEHVAHGKLLTLNITGIRTIQDAPQVIEFTAGEV